MTKEQISKMYEANFKQLMKAAQTCSCSHLHTAGHTSRKCSNVKHWECVKRERQLDRLSRSTPTSEPSEPKKSRINIAMLARKATKLVYKSQNPWYNICIQRRKHETGY